jgi:hypothetical protein
MEIAFGHRRFVVMQNATGYWIARDTCGGCIEGVFRTQREAVRFALIETSRGAALDRHKTAAPVSADPGNHSSTIAEPRLPRSPRASGARSPLSRAADAELAAL